MIKSSLLLDILDLALEHDSESEILKKQIPFLTENKFEYTGVGLYIYFKQEKAINSFRINLHDFSNSNENVFKRYDGIEIKNDVKNILADAVVHVTNGIIESIEISNKIGDYPNYELKEYEIYQAWLDCGKRRKIIRPI